MSSTHDDYIAFTNAAAFAEIGARTQIEITGADRVAFLNNYCTADIKRLTPGTGTEAFITSVKGKVLGHVFVYCGEESLVLDTVPGQTDVLLPHLDRYILASDVELRDASDGWAFLFIGGPTADDILTALSGVELPKNYLDFTTAFVGEAGLDAALARGGPISPDGYTCCCRDEDLQALADVFTNAGIRKCQPDVLQVLRVESGIPIFGVDVTDDHLPQEVNRNQQAISLTKGCYLGQETVARLDALGHVNKLLVRVKFAGENVPAVGAELSVDDKPVGKVTSSVLSPRFNAPLALAYVRAAYSEAGTSLASPVGNAEVLG